MLKLKSVLVMLKLKSILASGLVLVLLLMGVYFTDKEIKSINQKIYDLNNSVLVHGDIEKNNIAKRERIAAKRDLAEQEARTWAARRGYTIDHISDEGGVIMILYYNPRTGESDGEYFYY